MIRGNGTDYCAACLADHSPAQCAAEPITVLPSPSPGWVTARYRCRRCGHGWWRAWPKTDRATAVERAVVVVPDPELRARAAVDDELNRNARSLIRKALAAGWVARATLARGPWLDAHGRVSGLASSVVVRLRSPDGLSAVGVWRDGKYDCGYSWKGPHSLHPVTSTELNALVVA